MNFATRILFGLMMLNTITNLVSSFGLEIMVIPLTIVLAVLLFRLAIEMFTKNSKIIELIRRNAYNKVNSIILIFRFVFLH